MLRGGRRFAVRGMRVCARCGSVWQALTTSSRESRPCERCSVSDHTTNRAATGHAPLRYVVGCCTVALDNGFFIAVYGLVFFRVLWLVARLGIVVRGGVLRVALFL